MKKLLFFTLAIYLFTTACQKTEIPTGFNDPVFWSSFQIGAQDTSTVTAGLKGIYLFTGYSVTNGIFESVNSFADVNCPAADCPGSLSFEYRNYTDVDTIFQGQILRYRVPDSLVQNPTGYLTTFVWGDIFQMLPTQTFMFTNGMGSYSSPVQDVTLDLPDAPIEVTLTGYGANGLQGSTIQTILPSNPGAFPAVSIKATPNGIGYTLNAVQDSNGSAVVLYHWNTGDSSKTIEIDTTTVFSEYFVTVTDAFDKSASASLVSLPFPSQSTIRNAQLTLQATPNTNLLQIGTVAIQWVDANGTIWRSNRRAQPPNFSKFEVLERVEYDPNEKGDRVQKLRVYFKCKLFSPLGEPQDFEGVGVIGIALP